MKYTENSGTGTQDDSTAFSRLPQPIYGYLLAHYAVSALICRAATEADVDPDGSR